MTINNELEFQPLNYAGESLGRDERSANRHAKAHGKLFDTRGPKVGESIPVAAVGNPATGRVNTYLVRTSDLARLRRLDFVEAERPSKAEARQTLGLSVFTEGNPWVAVGEVDVVERLAREQPELLTVTVEADNRALIFTERPEDLREALGLAWTG